MRKYRKRIKISITKYNPIFRNELGHYKKNEWTAFSDINKKFYGKVFSLKEYMHVEDLYVKAIFCILDFFQSEKVKVNHIFKVRKRKDFKQFDSARLYATYQNMETGITIKDRNILDELVRLRLREYIAELELTIDTKSRTEVLFGFDYYMYLKTNIDVSSLLAQIRKLGLFTNR